MIQNLYDYVDDMGYCRNHFRDIVDSDARKIHTIFLCGIDTATRNAKRCIESDGYWIWDNSKCVNFPILFRHATKGRNSTIKPLDEYAKIHLVSSVIKNIFLDTTVTNTRLKGNTAVYIYYYHALYNVYDTPTKESLTESVVFYLSSTIKTMIDKELTLYRDHVELISEFIDIMRIRLNMERTVDRARNINLRI